MQSLAEENNHAETAFLRRTGEPHRFELRWFTPTMEVDLCGHATLASAHVLATEFGLSAAQIVFDTRRSGRLTVSRGEGYRLDLPASPSMPVDAPDRLVEALGAAVEGVYEGRYLMVVMRDEATVRTLRPDVAALAHFGGTEQSKGNVIVCAQADEGRPYRVVSRFFAPGSGIAEDPATGSAHCVLAPFWAARLGRLSLAFHQAYPGRGADIHCEVVGDRVGVSGQAVTVMVSDLRL
jgi:PhzF family phenazine biosynthesis protein